MRRTPWSCVPLMVIAGGCRPTAPQGGTPFVEPQPAKAATPDAGAVVAIGAGSMSAAQRGAALVSAVAAARPGDVLLLASGRFEMTEPVSLTRSGEPEAWITIRAQAGAVIDASAIAVAAPTGEPPFAQDQGAVRLDGVDYVRVEGLTVINSHNAGITVRDSSHVRLAANRTRNTFSSGIAVWGHNGSSSHVSIVDNDVARATDPALAPAWFDMRTMMMPHEAITVSGVQHFEVARNDVHHGFKEGIDIKGASQHGSVHHNDVRDMARQGIYVDAWAGTIEDVDVHHNWVSHCAGAGVVVSAEGQGAATHEVRIHHNRIVDNLGSGIFVSRFGGDGPRRNIEIAENHVEHNGWGPPHEGSPYGWITGGLYLFSTHVQGVSIRDNVFVDNRGFPIGVSAQYDEGTGVTAGLQARGIEIAGNVSFPAPSPDATLSTGWPVDEPDLIVPVLGRGAVLERPATAP